MTLKTTVATAENARKCGDIPRSIAIIAPALATEHPTLLVRLITETDYGGLQDLISSNELLDELLRLPSPARSVMTLASIRLQLGDAAGCASAAKAIQKLYPNAPTPMLLILRAAKFSSEAKNDAIELTRIIVEKKHEDLRLVFAAFTFLKEIGLKSDVFEALCEHIERLAREDENCHLWRARISRELGDVEAERLGFFSKKSTPTSSKLLKHLFDRSCALCPGVR